MVEAIEKAIASKLSSEITSIPSKPFPGSPEEFKNIPVTRGLILVRYLGSDFSEPTNTDQIIQERSLQFNVNLQIRNLREHDGSYSILDEIRKALSGFSPQGNKRILTIAHERFLDSIAGIWLWEQIWVLKVKQT